MKFLKPILGTGWAVTIAALLLLAGPALPTNPAAQTLRNEMPSSALARFKTTVERQAQMFPGGFFLEKPGAPVNGVALTFDDGPDAVYTRQILDVLDEHNVTATFFLVGRNMQQYPELTRDIKNAGHAVGGHSYDHPDLRTMPTSQAYDTQIEKSQAVFRSILGLEPAIFRPPYGALTDDQIRDFTGRGLKIVNWSVDSFDWDRTRNSAEEITATVLKYGHPGAIILMHSGGGNRSGTVAALPIIIDTLRGHGCRFLSIPDLLGITAERE